MNVEQNIPGKNTKAESEKFIAKDVNQNISVPQPDESISNIASKPSELNKIDDALLFFKKNIDNYSQSYNTYGSYGEALMIKDDKANSIINYKKSLELNPKNDNAKEKLKILEQ